MSHLEGCDVTVDFRCICDVEKPILIVIRKCDRKRCFWGPLDSNHFCYPTEIRVASHLKECPNCYTPDDQKIPIGDILPLWASNICDKYFRIFKNLDHWGFKIRGIGHGHEYIRMQGMIWWIKDAHWTLMDSQSVRRQMRRSEIVFGGHKLCATGLESDSGEHFRCAQNMRLRTNEIMQATNAARKDLEKEGFMIEGEIFRLIGHESERYGSYPSTGPDWRFLDGGHVEIIWELKDGQAVWLASKAEGRKRLERSLIQYNSPESA